MKKNIFYIGAALNSERVWENCSINKCNSFVRLAFMSDLKDITIFSQEITFKSKNFCIIKEKSHTHWDRFFRYKKIGNKIIIKVQEGYALELPKKVICDR